MACTFTLGTVITHLLQHYIHHRQQSLDPSYGSYGSKVAISPLPPPLPPLTPLPPPPSCYNGIITVGMVPRDHALSIQLTKCYEESMLHPKTTVKNL